MKTCNVPVAFNLDLGYRKISIKPGERAYPDEVARAYPLSDMVVPDDPDPEPTTEQHERHARKSKES